MAKIYCNHQITGGSKTSKRCNRLCKNGNTKCDEHKKFQNNQKRCNYRFTHGLKVGQLCNRSCLNEKCYQHTKFRNDNRKRCDYQFISGPKVGKFVIDYAERIMINVIVILNVKIKNYVIIDLKMVQKMENNVTLYVKMVIDAQHIQHVYIIRSNAAVIYVMIIYFVNIIIINITANNVE